MPQVFVYCPETEKPVYTGLNFDWFTFEGLEIGEQSLDCPVCGKTHSWTREDAFLRADGGG